MAAGGVRVTERFAPYVPKVAAAWAVEAPAATWRCIEGTFLFVDVSGFTALSERLAKRGAVGAEELTDVISTSFTELLAVAYAEGASLLKFGGDALLLLFDDDDHTRRACHAALRMRSTMRRVGRVESSVGNVRLRMSVGIHTGELHLFRVGRSHKELIVCGPAASETVTMEGTAGAGEIVVSGAVASRIDASLVGSAKGAGWLLRDRRIDAPADSYPPAIDPGAEASDAVPVGLREHLRAGSAESEHRQASIAFLHYDGTDELLRTEGPQAVADALDELVSDVQAAVEDQGVTFLASDIDHDGGKIILVGGVPRALGDDEGRMLRAVRSIADGSRRLAVRIGVNRGPIFAGEVGPAYRRTYTVMGDAVNLAARLMAKAEPGEILASRGILDRSRTLFETTALEPFLVKGKARPVQAHALGALAGIQEVRQSSTLPLIGRTDEVATLAAAWASAVAGEGRVVVLTGEAGAGKTRLAEELRRRAAEHPEAQLRLVQCEQYESATPYFAIRVLLRAVLPLPDDDDPASALTRAVGALDERLLPFVPLLGDVLHVEVPDTPETAELAPKFRRQRTAAVAADLLAAAIPGPAVLSFDDVHWMDDASRDVLLRLSQAAAAKPWVVCITSRDENGTKLGGSSATTVPLGPLDEASAHLLIDAATAHSPLPPYRRAEIVQRAGGSPLFLEELLRIVNDDELGDDAPLPDSVEGLLAATIDALPAAERRLLRYAAVLGATFDLALLEGVVEDVLDVDVRASLLRLGEHLVLEADGRLRFRHRLLRDVSYRTLPFKRRQELHRRAAERIEHGAGVDGAAERAAVLAHHYHQAQAWEQAWTYGRLGGDGARQKFANLEATELYRRAIEAARRMSDVDRRQLAETWTLLGTAANVGGLFDQAAFAFRQAARLQADDPVARAEHYRNLAGLAQRTGNRLGSVRWVGRGLRTLEGIDSVEAQRARASLLVLYAQSRRMLGRSREALRWLEEAVRAAEVSQNDLALAQAYSQLDPTHLELGQAERAVHGEKAIQIFEKLGQHGEKAILLNNLGSMAQLQGRWADALALYQEASAAFEKIGDGVYSSWVSCNVAEIFADQGHLDEAEAILRRVLAASRSLAVPLVEALATRHLGRVALRQGRTDEALELLEDARHSYVASGMVAQTLEIDVLLAEGHLRRAEVDVAVEQLRAAQARAKAGGGHDHVPAIHRLLGYAAAAQGRLVDAWADLDASLATARELGARFDVALTLEAMSVVAELGGRAVEPSAATERTEILAALGVDATPPPPVGGGGMLGRC